MTQSYTRTQAETFSLTHAKYLASKVAADLHLCSIYYGHPTKERVLEYEQELIEMLRGSFVEQYEFGFRRDGKRILCWRYTVSADGILVADDNSGKLSSGVDISTADFYNYLWRTNAWGALSPSDRSRIEDGLPFKRVGQDAPADGSGYWITDKNYSSGGVALGRQTFRPSL